MRKVPLAMMLSLVLAFGSGCSQSAKKVPIPLDQVPENLIKIAKEKLPGVNFDKAFKEANGDFELIGKDKKGKVREIDVSPSGEVTQIE
jgi:hypothetical protein